MDKFTKSFLRGVAGLALVVGLTSSLSVFAMDSVTKNARKGSEYPTYPKLNYGTGARAALIKRGEYLAKLGDCIACHTRHYGGKPFAGGLPIKTPFGTLYTPNITPDKKTGIGGWTEQQFFKVMHEGISPKGYYYYPAFPYLYFNKITNKDLHALWAYLQAIPAVDQTNRKNDMHWPFSIRFMQLGWRMLFFHFQKTGPYQYNPHKSKAWNRGAYIVLSFGHCDMCHTPMHYFISKKWVLGAPNWKYHLAGAFVQGYYAPNITGADFKNDPASDFYNVFKKDELIGGGKVAGPMYEANHDSLRYLTKSDVVAITTYLESLNIKEPVKSSSGGPGAGIFTAHCAMCHVSGAGGAPKIGDKAAWAPRIKLGLPTLYKNAINGIGGMPAKGACTSCSDQDIKEAVQYIVSKSGKNAAGVQTKMVGKPYPKLTYADGKKIYQRYCSSCHNGSYPGAPKLGDKAAWAPIIKQGMPILFARTINGYNNMPARGSCSECNTAQLVAAVKYMVRESKTKGDYSLW